MRLNVQASVHARTAALHMHRATKSICHFSTGKDGIAHFWKPTRKLPSPVK